MAFTIEERLGAVLRDDKSDDKTVRVCRVRDIMLYGETYWMTEEVYLPKKKYDDLWVFCGKNMPRQLERPFSFKILRRVTDFLFGRVD